MADERDDASRRGEAPAYRVYRSKPRGLRERLRGEDAGLAELTARADGSAPRGEGGAAVAEAERGAPRRRLRPWPRRRRGVGLTPGRVVRWLLTAVVGWLLLSLVLFLVSAQIERGKVSDEA